MAPEGIEPPPSVLHTDALPFTLKSLVRLDAGTAALERSGRSENPEKRGLLTVLQAIHDEHDHAFASFRLLTPKPKYFVVKWT